MRHDHRPYALKRLLNIFERAWFRHFTAPQLDAVGSGSLIMKPWHLHIHGRGIHFGEAVHVITSKDRTVRLTTWQHEGGGGEIHIHDHALLCPGVRIDAASKVVVGRGTMLAAGAYLTDADWHGIYERATPIGETRPIILRENVWIGDGATICKGVEIGANTIVGAGAVVTKSMPANVVAAGNPAKVVKTLDADRAFVTRSDLLADYDKLTHDMEMLDQALRRKNTWWGWLRATLAPRKSD